MLSGESLVSQARSARPADLGLTFAIPIFFFQGAEDFTTPTALAREYLEMISAPQKAFVPIEGGGHFTVFMRADQFLAELVRRVLPVAVGKRGKASHRGRRRPARSDASRTRVRARCEDLYQA